MSEVTAAPTAFHHYKLSPGKAADPTEPLRRLDLSLNPATESYCEVLACNYTNKKAKKKKKKSLKYCSKKLKKKNISI